MWLASSASTQSGFLLLTDKIPGTLHVDKIARSVHANYNKLINNSVPLYPSWHANNQTTFEEILFYMQPGGLLSCLEHPSSNPYPNHISPTQNLQFFYFKV
jgi:hypothetical protein